MVSTDPTPDELQTLRAQLRDLAAALALPALWKGRDPLYIADSMLDILGSLLRADLACARLPVPPEDCPAIDTCWPRTARLSSEFESLLQPGNPSHEAFSVAEVDNPSSGAPLQVVTLRHDLLGASWQVAVGVSRADFPTSAERFLLRVTVEQASLAIESAVVLRREQAGREAAERARAEAEALLRVGQTLSVELNLEHVVQVATDAATELSGAQFGAFFYNVLNDQGESYMLYTLSGVPRESFARFPMPRNTAVFGPTFRGEGIVRLDDVTSDPHYGHSPPYHGMPSGHLPVRSYLAVPVISRGGEVLGGLFFGHAEVGVFTERAERLVAGIAAQAAIVMDNARLYDAERSARGQAEEAVRTRDVFLSIAAHELRTPITALKGTAQLALRAQSRGLLSGDRAERSLRSVEQTANRLVSLTNDLLDVSRIQGGQLALRTDRLDLVALLRGILERHAEQLDRAHVLEADIPSQPVWIDADAVRLEQVFENLLDNAVKYSPAGGAIEVSLAAADGNATVTVKDPGIGLPEGTGQSIFEPFGRAPNAAARNLPGLGLGLYVSRRIVELHGGAMSAQSPGEGEGSTFHVRLPRLTG